MFISCLSTSFLHLAKTLTMFGDITGMMGKLHDARKSAEETKVRLNSVLVSDAAAGGAIRITVTVNKEIKEIEISEALMSNKEELTDTLIVALN